MTARAEYTAEEWTLLQMAPFTVGLAVSYADGAGILETIREGAALISERGRAVERYPGNELVRSLLAEAVEPGPVPADALSDTAQASGGVAADLRRRALDDCRRLVDLLDDRSHPVEADGYKRYLMDIARATAEAVRHGSWIVPGPRVDEEERTVLCEVAEILGVPVGGPPGEIECGVAPGPGRTSDAPRGPEAPLPDTTRVPADADGPRIPSGPIGPE